MELRALSATGLGLVAAAGWTWTVLTPIVGGSTVGFLTSIAVAGGFTAAALRVARGDLDVLVRKTGGLWVAALGAMVFTAYSIAIGSAGAARVPNLLFATGLFAMAVAPANLRVGATLAAVGTAWWVVTALTTTVNVWTPASFLAAAGLVLLSVPWDRVRSAPRPDAA